MKKLYPVFICLFLTTTSAHAQWCNQYFDGADTSVWNSLNVKIEPDSTNIWQIGPPQKTIFNAAASTPNALVTDTIAFYPVNNVSRVNFQMPLWGWHHILAVQWKQKLDMDSGLDGGLVEFKFHADSMWQNAFDNPFVYAFYGFDGANKDTLPGGEAAFSGTDTLWRDIWLCFDPLFTNTISDTLYFQFTFVSDSIDTPHEGWLIDNILAHATIVHTVKNSEQTTYLRAYPSITSGVVHIEAEKTETFHIIESIELIGLDGRVAYRHGRAPVKFWININHCNDGMYFLRVTTNKSSRTFPLLLQKS